MASGHQFKSVPAKASEKNSSVSMTEATSEPISGAFHHDWLRQRLKTLTSASCETMKAAPEASAMRQGATARDTATAMAKPVQATRRAAPTPTARLVRSVTRKATG